MPMINFFLISSVSALWHPKCFDAKQIISGDAYNTIAVTFDLAPYNFESYRVFVVAGDGTLKAVRIVVSIITSKI